MAFIPSNMDDTANKMRNQRVMGGPGPAPVGPTPPPQAPPNPVEMLKALLAKAMDILSKMGGPGPQGPMPGQLGA